MKEIKVDPDNPGKDIVITAAQAVKEGKIVAFPTDTIYGLGVDISSESALNKVFKAKKRQRNKPLTVFIADIGRLKKIAFVTSRTAELLAKKFWPGALTLILPARENLPDAVTRAGTVGVRLPASPLLREIVRQAGTLLATTSANMAGSPSPTGADTVREELGDSIDVLLDGGPSRSSMASTVIDATQEPIKVIRLGSITVGSIEKALEKS